MSEERIAYKADRILPSLLGIIVLAIHLGSLFTYLANPTAISWWIIGAGCTLSVCGITLRFIAIYSLGDCFTTKLQVVQGQPLVNSGVYSQIRHPSYAGMLLATLGVTLVMASKAGLIIWGFVLLPLVIWRVHREERVMIAGFAGYRCYMKKTARLLPYIY